MICYFKHLMQTVPFKRFQEKIYNQSNYQIVIGQFESESQHRENENDGNENRFSLLVDQVFDVGGKSERQKNDVFHRVKTVEHQLAQKRRNVEAGTLRVDKFRRPFCRPFDVFVVVGFVDRFFFVGRLRRHFVESEIVVKVDRSQSVHRDVVYEFKVSKFKQKKIK